MSIYLKKENCIKELLFIKNIKFLIILFIQIAFTKDAFSINDYILKSPDGKISVDFSLTSYGEPFYTISYSGVIVLRQSKLGIIRSDDDFSTNLTLESASDESTASENYKMLHGKRLNCSYYANKRVFI